MNQSKICLTKGLRQHWRLLVSLLFILSVGGWCFQRYFLRAKPELLNYVEEEQAASEGIETMGLMQENPLSRVESMSVFPSNTLHRPDPLEIMIPLVIRGEKGETKLRNENKTVDVVERPIRVVRVQVKPQTAEIAIGESINLTATAYDNQGTVVSGAFHWNSFNPEIAGVDSSGKVKGNKPGTTLIKAMISGVTEPVQITVVDIELTLSYKPSNGIGEASGTVSHLADVESYVVIVYTCTGAGRWHMQPNASKESYAMISEDGSWYLEDVDKGDRILALLVQRKAFEAYREKPDPMDYRRKKNKISPLYEEEMESLKSNKDIVFRWAEWQPKQPSK